MKKSLLSAFIIFALTAQLVGCNANNQEEISSSSTETSSTSEVHSSSTSTPEEKAPVEKVEPLKWSPLYSLMSYSNIRNVAKEVLGIKALEGSVFIDLDGHQEMNNTLYNALRNEEFAKTQLENKEITDKLCEAVKKTFADIGETENEQMAAFFNSFWELLPEENGKDSVEFNGNKALTRAQAMTLVMRAMTPVEKNNKPNENKLFTEAVGDSVYTDFAQYLDSKVYLNTQNGLNEQTFNANMTRAEYIWLCLSSVFAESELNEIDISGVELSDCEASTSSDSSLDSAIANPSNGLPVELVNMLQKANALGIISSDTDWERSVTKTDAVNLFISTVKAYSSKFGYAIKQDAPKDDELLIAKAKASYERNKDKVTINEEKYVSEYIRLANQGFEEKDIEAMILAEFAKRDEPILVEKPEQPWTETEVSGTRYVNQNNVNSRTKAVAGSTVVKQYSLNDTVTITAKTDTGYFKLADGTFIHGDYLSTSKVEKTTSSSSSGTSGTGGTGGTTTQKEPQPYTGKLTPPETGVTIIREETGVSWNNKILPVYLVNTETGQYWYKPTNGTYYKTKDDALQGRNALRIVDVLPSTHKDTISFAGLDVH